MNMKKKVKSSSLYTWLRNEIVYLELLLERNEIPIIRQLRNFFQKKTKTPAPVDLSAMKLGVAYNLFDSEELLEYSIKSIRKNVDFVCVVWQKISYHGEPCSDGMEELLNDLMKKKLIDQLYLYTPDRANTGGEISSIKRNIGLELCRQHGCNYHMSMDADEFYTDKQFIFMKEEMLRGDYGTGYCRQIQYYKDAIYVLKSPERNYVPTIEKITPNTKYVYYIPCPVDVSPERKTNNVAENELPYRIFKRSECEMHHMTFIRKDIAKKIRNSSLDKAFSSELSNKVADHYKNWKYPQKCMWAGENLLEIVEVPRQFDIYPFE